MERQQPGRGDGSLGQTDSNLGEVAAWDRQKQQPGTDSSLGETDSLGQIHSGPGQTVSSLGETETDGSLGETTARGRQTAV